MTKINEIQRAILELEGGRFQRLANAYLNQLGYTQINSLGSVIASDKTRPGTPDAFIPNPNGKYTLVEHTSQGENLFGKLEDDLHDCLNEEKVGIPADKIEKVIFCHTGQLKVGEHRKLVALCEDRFPLEIYGIATLASDLAERYPRIAREYLDVAIDSGQVLRPDEFVHAYGKNKLTAPLDTAFYGRSQEIDDALKALLADDVLLVTGPPGVGKSRFALEVARRYQEDHPDYKTYCLLNRRQDLYQDLRSYLSGPGSYLLVADDANRLSSFDYLVYILQNRRPDQEFKVLATVRDYALEAIRGKAKMYGSFSELALSELDNERLREILRNEFEIHNPRYLERIQEIAQGNPRLAVMAARIASEENSLESIQDVSELYEAYFASIRDDMEKVDDSNLLRVAGIVSFFRVVDRSHDEMMAEIKTAFGLDPEVFWEKVRELHRLEILDMHANHIVRTSDQVLATYFFYRAFFKEQSLDFSILLKRFFPSWQHRLVEALNPVLQAFNFPQLKEAMAPHIRNRWQWLRDHDEDHYVRFMELFCLFDPTNCLRYVRDTVQDLEPEPLELAEQLLDFRSKGSQCAPLPPALRIVKQLSRGGERTVQSAISLALDWADTRASDAKAILRLLKDDFGFRVNSALDGFASPRKVLELVWERTAVGENLLFSSMFIVIARRYLDLEFRETRPGPGRTIVFTTFRVPGVPAIKSLREETWRRLFELFRANELLRPLVLEVIRGYGRVGDLGATKLLMTDDAVLLSDLLLRDLDPTCYQHCVVVQSFLNQLDRNTVPYDESLRDVFTNTTYHLSRLLLDQFPDRRDPDVSYSDYREERRQQLARYLSTISEDDIDELFDQCRAIANERAESGKYQFGKSFVELLTVLAESDFNFFKAVLSSYLLEGEFFKVCPSPVVHSLLDAEGADGARSFLTSADYDTKPRWLLAFYHCLSEQDIDEQALKSMYALYETAPPEHLPYGFAPLLKYQQADPRVVPHVVELLLTRRERASEHINFSLLFNRHVIPPEEVVRLFKGELDLLKRAYLVNIAAEAYADNDCEMLSQLVDEEPRFLLEFVEYMLSNGEWESSYDHKRDYSFIWRRADVFTIMEPVAERIKEFEHQGVRLHSVLSTTLFQVGGDENRHEILNCQDRFLHMMIRRHSQSCDWMRFLFRLIGDLSKDRRLSSLQILLAENSDLGVFKQISLEPSHMSWSGSVVPVLEGRVEFYQSLLPLLNTVELLEHRQVIEERIDSLRQEIATAKKAEFMSDS